MGGFTAIRLIDCSKENIDRQNQNLKELGVPKKYHFYSVDDTKIQWEAYKKGEGYWPEHQFPKNIPSFEEFCKYWSPRHLGEVFVPHYGTLTFDCYFGRTSKKALRAIGKYIIAHGSQIANIEGSTQTFFERALIKSEQELIPEFPFHY